MESKRLAVALSFIVIFVLGGSGMVFSEEKEKKSVNEKILEILIQKQIITKEQYDELKKEAQAEEEAQKPKVVAGFDKGFYIATADKKSQIKFDGRLHVDSKWYLTDNPGNDSFFIRRARLCSSGTVYEYYDFRIEYEAGKGKTGLNDAFMNIHFWPEAQFEAGQFKVPYFMEELQSDNWIYFIERSLADSLAPSRDIGVMVHGGFWGDLLYYQAGVFNGFRLNEASDADDGKDGAFRVVVAPFKQSDLWAIKGLRLGGAVTYGKEDLNTDQWWNSGQFKTAAGTTYLAIATSAVQNGDRIRMNPELYWEWGSTVLMAEYAKVKFDGLKLSSQSHDFDIDGGYVALSHFLTGEKFVFKNGIPARVVPLQNFAFGTPGWGAFQVGARWEFLKADKDLFRLGYADPAKYTDKTSGFTLGLNWYPNPIYRFMINYYHMKFDGDITVNGQRLDDEDVILTRFQVAL